MDKKYWDNIAEYYESEIFPVLENDTEGLVVGLIEKYGDRDCIASDLGCGIGHFLPFLSREFNRVTAVDISEVCIDRAKEECTHLDNVEYICTDISAGTADLPEVEFCLSVNALITPSLEDRLKMFDIIGTHIKKDGHLVLVVPSLESAIFCDFRQIESNLRSGLRPAAAVNADFQTRKSLRNSDGLFEGNILIDDVPTKHYLKEELIAILSERNLSIIEFSKIEYPWSAEFISAPRWMSEPFPWDWLVVARKV